MLFVITAMDINDGGKLRAATRPAHFEYARDTGVIKLGGPFLDAEGNMIGSLIIMEAENLEAAQKWAANDPYAKAGVYAHYDLRPWKATVNPSGVTL
ncbi:MAG TPA: YciI family protein [Rhizomicrobium sp.]|jgi:uncharacterized protein YciI|nr:YciI family protein [Rhizomicrobium sp.]